MSLKDHIDEVERRIAEVCRRSGRNREDVRLVAVSKKFPLAVVLEANRLGLRDFGENYAQELRNKQRGSRKRRRRHASLALHWRLAEKQGEVRCWQGGSYTRG